MSGGRSHQMGIVSREHGIACLFLVLPVVLESE